MIYSVLIVTPPGYPHSQCFNEVADTICDGLKSLGYEAAITTVVRPGTRHIVLGSHLLVDHPLALPPDSILYNLEQLAGNPFFSSPAFYALLRRYAVWDYAQDNLSALAAQGVRAQALLPICYYEGLTRIAPSATKDIDVLFIGSTNDRRQNALVAMDAAGLQVVSLFNKYGAERDAFIARSKLLLNVHFYPAKILEQVRISYYLANKVAVLSELSSNDAVDTDWGRGICAVPYEQLVAEAVRLCRDDVARADLCERGFAFIKERSIVPHLKAALAATTTPQLSEPAASLRRNDPCHCGSGKRFKHCHGKGL